MDPALNPYAPGAGVRPPAMVGRDRQLAQMDIAIQRTKRQLKSRPPCFWGLRGVGKTVLLTELRRQAVVADWLTVSLEAAPTQRGHEVARQRFARDLVLAARKKKLMDRHPLRSSLGSISSFSLSVGLTGLTLGVEPTKGRADTGDATQDLIELASDISDDLTKRGLGFAVFIDEMQDLDSDFAAAVLAMQHRANQEEWPVFVIGAGLPNLPRRLSDIRTYAERLFAYSEIGPLSPEAATAALVRPAEGAGAAFSPEAVQVLVEASNGYPYFLQEYGKAIWELAQASPFTRHDAVNAVMMGAAALDGGFFPARWERATKSERDYLAAMAKDGDQGSATATIADRLGRTIAGVGPVRAKLMAKGLVYAPEHGIVKFSVPAMADFIRRQDAWTS